MYPSVIAVTVRNDYLLDIRFNNGESGKLDMKPYLNFGIFKRIRDYSAFEKVSVAFDTIEWESGVDLDPEFVYAKCEFTQPLETLERNNELIKVDCHEKDKISNTGSGS